jgi:SAM-dependent methyltransferase
VKSDHAARLPHTKPMTDDASDVRHQTHFDSSAPSPFIEAWVTRIQQERHGGRALDVAMGRGRHARLLAASGFTTFGVDITLDAVRTAVKHAAANGLVIHGWCADLTQTPLPDAAFDLILVCRYLQRDLFHALERALTPGGILLYETFTVKQHAYGRGPTSDRYLLNVGELPTLASGLTVLSYEEIDAPDAVARLAARRTRSRS